VIKCLKCMIYYRLSKWQLYPRIEFLFFTFVWRTAVLLGISLANFLLVWGLF